MSRFQPTYPPGDHDIPLRCPASKCQHDFKHKLTVNEEGLLVPEVVRCPKCNRWLSVSPDWKIYVFWKLALGYALGRVLMPFFYLDAMIWVVANRISKFAQKRLHLSKYVLALASYVLGIGVMFTSEAMKAEGLSPFPFFIALAWTWLCWDFLKWCWKKILEGDQEKGDVLVKHDVVMRIRSRKTRMIILGLVVAFVPLYFIAANPLAPLDLILIGLGHYLVDSDFIPPSKRDVLELGRKWVGGEA